MQLVDGKKIAKEITDDLRKEVAHFSFRPLLVDILVGENPVSFSYTSIKAKTAREIGCQFQLLKLAKSATEKQVIAQIKKCARKPALRGLIVQLPVPENLDKAAVVNAIPSPFDIDCLGRKNLKAFYAGIPRYLPPAAAAVMLLLDKLPFSLDKKTFLVIGQGELVGKPVTHLLKFRGFKVLTADSRTPDLALKINQADVIVSATGNPGLITGLMLKSGAVVIDAGAAEVAGSIVGDVDISSFGDLSVWLSPVPGGVGPVTVAMLCKNLIAAAKTSSKK